MKPVQGVVLAGGKSSRFGSDKALAVLNGKRLIEHAVDLIRAVGLPVCVVTQAGRDYSFLDCPILFDREPHLGPLAGLARAFEEFPQSRILALTCDMPFIEKKDLKKLLEHPCGVFGAVLYRSDNDYFQPFPGIYEVSLINASFFHDENVRSMQAFIKNIEKVLQIEVETSPEHFRNINQFESLNNNF